MKEIKFRPLRLDKKTGKIIVLSYMGWRNIKTQSDRGITLIVDEGYKKFDENERVFNYKGDELFWRKYNPFEIPIYHFKDRREMELGFWSVSYGTDWLHYSAPHVDCDGVPTLSHGYIDQITNGYSFDTMKEFSPLTVADCKMWVGWFIYQLKNTTIKAL